MRLLLILAAIAPLQAQQFDAASVKVTPPPGGEFVFGTMPLAGGPGTADPTHITWNNVPLWMVLMTAYDVKQYQITGPGWFQSERYDFALSVPEGATKAQVSVMWQKLLAERFGMVIHHESKEFQVDELVVARGGHKLKETTATGLADGPPKVENGKLVGPGAILMMRSRPNGPVAEFMAIGQGLAGLTSQLSGRLGHPVVDKTGLTGKYDFNVEFSPESNVRAGLDALPDLATAVQQQLGLRLEKGKAMLDVIVVDKAEKVPTAN